MPSIYTWTHTRDGNEVTLPLVVPINHLDPLQRRKLATDKSCCCDAGCPDCTRNDTCTKYGCVDDDGGAYVGWFDTYEHAWAAGNLGHTHCEEGDCCPGGLPCFVVGCDEDSPHYVAGDCFKYYWKLCCSCCESCADAAPLPGAAGAGCIDPGDPTVYPKIPPSCEDPYFCTQSAVGDGYCTASDAVNNVPAGFNPCDGFNCSTDLGCYYITCDDETKCQKRFNWVTCNCQS